VMAYEAGRILQVEFGYDARSVTLNGEDWDHSRHSYAIEFPRLTIAEMEDTISQDDILMANPSFSEFLFGLRLPGRKLCYVQGFSTFSLLDTSFDHYVVNSSYLQTFLSCMYQISAPVIPSYVIRESFPDISGWRSRPENSFVVYLKGPYNIAEIAHERIRPRTGNLLAHADVIKAGSLPRRELLERIARCRYFLSLSPAEGLGIVPLEAMALQTVVVGFDAFGGRHYFRNMQNCAVAALPNIDAIANHLVDLVRNPDRAERLAAAGMATAEPYTYDRYRHAWRSYFVETVGLKLTA